MRVCGLCYILIANDIKLAALEEKLGSYLSITKITTTITEFKNQFNKQMKETNPYFITEAYRWRVLFYVKKIQVIHQIV